MYFDNREHAGKILADELFEKYRYENCAVVSLSDGGVLVGEPIAAKLHCILTMLVIEDIAVPGEGLTFGSVSQTGNFSYNSDFSSGEVEEYESEYHGYFEEEKREAFQRINRLIGDGGLVNNDMLHDRVVILVSDGLDDKVSINSVNEFLKPIRIKKLIVASPVSNVQIVDKLHIVADELHILDVKANYMGTDHYYDDNNIPSHEDTIEKINKIILNWQ